MITDAIINAFLFVPYLLLSGISSFNFNLTFPADMFEIIKDITCGVVYVLPVARLFVLFQITIALYTFKIAVALVVRAKSFIPTMGA